MAAKVLIAIMALAVLTALVVADQEQGYAMEDFVEFVKRGKMRGRNRGKMGPLTREDMEPCERFGQECVCDNRLDVSNDNRFLICT